MLISDMDALYVEFTKRTMPCPSNDFASDKFGGRITLPVLLPNQVFWHELTPDVWEKGEDSTCNQISGTAMLILRVCPIIDRRAFDWRADSVVFHTC